MARPENRSEGRSISISLPQRTFDYLVHLANLGFLGKTENEVATHILVSQAQAMYKDDYHNWKIPPADVS
jgi:hypothetical protein